MANWNENQDLIHGDNLLLYLTSGKTVVAYATNCSLQIDAESIDTSSKFSCRFNSNMGGKIGYTISCDSLYTANEDGISFDDLMACGTMAAAKEKGLVRSEGKEYVMQDGDIVLFRFNV